MTFYRWYFIDLYVAYDTLQPGTFHIHGKGVFSHFSIFYGGNNVKNIYMYCLFIALYFYLFYIAIIF